MKRQERSRRAGGQVELFCDLCGGDLRADDHGDVLVGVKVEAGQRRGFFRHAVCPCDRS